MSTETGYKMKKTNRVLYVNKGQVDSYLKQGYDQISEDGDVIKRATGGRTISIAEHNKVLDELDKVKADGGGDNAEFKKENAALKGKVTKLEKELAELKTADAEIKTAK